METSWKAHVSPNQLVVPIHMVCIYIYKNKCKINGKGECFWNISDKNSIKGLFP